MNIWEAKEDADVNLQEAKLSSRTKSTTKTFLARQIKLAGLDVGSGRPSLAISFQGPLNVHAICCKNLKASSLGQHGTVLPAVGPWAMMALLLLSLMIFCCRCSLVVTWLCLFYFCAVRSFLPLGYRIRNGSVKVLFQIWIYLSTACCCFLVMILLINFQCSPLLIDKKQKKKNKKQQQRRFVLRRHIHSLPQKTIIPSFILLQAHPYQIPIRILSSCLHSPHLLSSSPYHHLAYLILLLSFLLKYLDRVLVTYLFSWAGAPV